MKIKIANIINDYTIIHVVPCWYPAINCILIQSVNPPLQALCNYECSLIVNGWVIIHLIIVHIYKTLPIRDIWPIIACLKLLASVLNMKHTSLFTSQSFAAPAHCKCSTMVAGR